MGLRVAAAIRAGLRPRLATGERQTQDRALDRADLLQERTRVVRQVIALADLLYARRDLGVAGARHVRKEVVLDLVAKVAAGHMEQRRPLDVGGTQQLAHV